MESEKLRGLMVQMSELANEAILQLRDELNDLKAQCTAEKRIIDSHCFNVNESLEQLVKASELKERETLQRLTVDHELEQSDLKKVIQGRTEEIQSLRAENQCLERSLIKSHEESRLQKDEYERLLQQSREGVNELKQRIEEFEIEKEKATKEVREELTKKYKDEMESIRSRFKLMSIMERSPSDSSLEKIDHNVIDLVKHNDVLAQLKEKYTEEKDKAVRDAVYQERIKWESKMEHEMAQLKIRNEAEQQVIIINKFFRKLNNYYIFILLSNGRTDSYFNLFLGIFQRSNAKSD